MVGFVCWQILHGFNVEDRELDFVTLEGAAKVSSHHEHHFIDQHHQYFSTNCLCSSNHHNTLQSVPFSRFVANNSWD